MASAIIGRLWHMGLQSCALILIILAVRPFLKKYPRIYSYSLWALAGISLLCPIMIQSPFSLQPKLSETLLFSEDSGTVPDPSYAPQAAQVTPGSTATHIQENILKNSKEIESGKGINSKETESKKGIKSSAGIEINIPNTLTLPLLSYTENADKGISILPFYTKNANKEFSILPFLYAIYLAGMFFMSCRYMVQYQRVRRQIACAVRDSGNIWLCEMVSSPFVIGIWKPRILLPYTLNDLEKSHILRHERTHIRHHDPLIRLIGLLCICLHWWNPLVWLAVQRMNQDMEIFCDESTLRYATFEERRLYAKTLLSFAERQSYFFAGLSFGESNTKKRVENIMKKRKNNLIILFCVVLLAVFCIGAFMTIPKAINTDNTQNPSDNTDSKNNGLTNNDDSENIIGPSGNNILDNDSSLSKNDNPENPNDLSGNNNLENIKNPESSKTSTENNVPGNKGNIPESNIPENKGDIASDAGAMDKERAATLTAYQSVLNNLYFDHVWADHSPCSIPDWGEEYDMSLNSFAIYDIDFDGRDELIISFVNSYMAGMQIKIYDYDAGLNSVREELLEFPGLTFYSNGIVEAPLSHNHGMAATFDGFWPYSLYQYDSVSDTYQQIANVDAWDKVQLEKDYDGNPFPTEIDLDGDGIVYLPHLTASDTKLTLDGEEYKQWRNSYIDESRKISSIPYQPITEENINAIISDEG